MCKVLKHLILLCFASLVFAENDVEIEGEIAQKTLIPNHHEIKLLKLKFSDHGQEILNHRLLEQLHPSTFKLQQSRSNLPTKVELGMGNVPVLDQGAHGTCATFAVTAAIDASINKGDYISQLCLLSLSEYLSHHAHFSSMWDGAYPNDVFNLISTFGLINKSNEQNYGCAGYHSYPQFLTPNSPEMSIDDYYQYSEAQDAQVNYIPSNYLNPAELLDKSLAIQNSLTTTKHALAQGERVVIGIILIFDQHAGAYGHFHQDDDTWMLTQDMVEKIRNDKIELAGHAMVITGYDDQAEVIDEQGVIHQGLFTLRNSWGSKAGDAGNYYLTYDYFKSLTIDLTKIKKIV